MMARRCPKMDKISCMMALRRLKHWPRGQMAEMERNFDDDADDDSKMASQ